MRAAVGSAYGRPEEVTMSCCPSRLAAISASVMISIGACSAPGDEPLGSNQSALTEVAAARAASRAQRLSEEVDSYRRARSAALSPGERAAEEARARGAGQASNRLAASWSRRGFVSALTAPDLRIPSGLPAHRSPSEHVESFVAANKDLFGLAAAPDEHLELTRERRVSGRGRTVLQYDQSHDKLPVFFSTLVVHVRDDGTIGWLLSNLTPESVFPGSTPTVTSDEASAVAGGTGSVALGFFDPLLAGLDVMDVRLAWKVMESTGSAYVDAHTSEILYRQSAGEHDKHREVFRCEGCTSIAELPGDLRHDDVCHGGSGEAACVAPAYCTGDPLDPASWCETSTMESGPKDARNYSGDVDDYLWNRLGRDGWDNTSGSPTHRLRISADVDDVPGMDACQGVWRSMHASSNPAQVILGTKRHCLDVVAHEVFHGVDESSLDITGDLCSASTSVAEGISDVFGELVEKAQAGSTDWIHGTGCESCATSRNSNLATPGAYSVLCDESSIEGTTACGAIARYDTLRPQPDSFADYNPECGSYWNMTIASKIGHLMGRDGSETHRGVYVQGAGEWTASTVFYHALKDYLGGAASFTNLRDALVEECGSTNDVTMCMRAAMAPGLWSSDVDHAATVPGGTALGYHENLRFNAYWDGGYLKRRYRTCSLNGTCPWSDPLWLYSVPQSTPGMADDEDGYLWMCFLSAYGGVWCDRRPPGGASGSAWLIGPDPLGYDIQPDISIAYYASHMFLAYRKSDGYIYWQKKFRYASDWSDVQRTSFQTVSGPVLASASEDYYGFGDHLWMAWVGPDERINYQRFDPVADDWIGDGGQIAKVYDEGTPDEYTGYYRSPDRPAAAFFRGRLHIAATNVGLDASTTDDSVWYGSCTPPCQQSDWSAFVRQDGGSRAGILLDNWGARDGYLHLVHRLASSDALVARYKLSE